VDVLEGGKGGGSVISSGIKREWYVCILKKYILIIFFEKETHNPISLLE
jgi:hypothetical protein